MGKIGKIKKTISLVLAIGLVAGCGNGAYPVEIIPTEKPVERLSMLETAEISYEVPKTHPSISVDINGYDVSSEKVAYLAAANVPKGYVIKNVSDGEPVYSGTIRLRGIEAEDGLETGIIDFSDFSEPGNYYIETDLLGKSYNFSIHEGKYEALYDTYFKRLKSLRCSDCHKDLIPFESNLTKTLDVSGGWHTNAEGEKDVVEGCIAVMDICTAYEYYQESFPDNDKNGIPDAIDEAKYEIEWLYKMQNQETGGVYTSVSYQTPEGSAEPMLVIGGETTRATAFFCACLAKFSYTINKFDNAEAAKAIQAAGIAWKCVEANKEIVSPDQMFRASVEMYRATGYDVYRRVIHDYLKTNSDKQFESRTVLDGAITYLDTSRATDVSYCTKLMANFMSRTEEKVAAADASRYGVEPGELSVSELLRNAYEMILVEFIISNNAYLQTEEDYIHYIFGRNAEGIDYSGEIVSPDDCVKLMTVALKLAD